VIGDLQRQVTELKRRVEALEKLVAKQQKPKRAPTKKTR